MRHQKEGAARGKSNWEIWENPKACIKLLPYEGLSSLGQLLDYMHQRWGVEMRPNSSAYRCILGGTADQVQVRGSVPVLEHCDRQASPQMSFDGDHATGTLQAPEVILAEWYVSPDCTLTPEAVTNELKVIDAQVNNGQVRSELVAKYTKILRSGCLEADSFLGQLSCKIHECFGPGFYDTNRLILSKTLPQEFAKAWLERDVYKKWLKQRVASDRP